MKFPMEKSIFLLFVIACFSNAVTIFPAHAGGDSFTQKDREALIRIDERLNQIDKRFEQIDKRFEQVDKRFAELRQDMNRRFEELRQDINKRFEQVDKRFEQVDKRFESMQNLMMAIVGAFAAIVAVSIGFAIWDRRTMVRPFEDKMKKIEDDIVSDRKRLERLFEVLRNYARNHPDLADILKQFSIL